MLIQIQTAPPEPLERRLYLPKFVPLYGAITINEEAFIRVERAACCLDFGNMLNEIDRIFLSVNIDHVDARKTILLIHLQHLIEKAYIGILFSRNPSWDKLVCIMTYQLRSYQTTSIPELLAHVLGIRKSRLEYT